MERIQGPPVATLLPFTFRDRAFLRATLPESQPDGSPFLVARVVAGRYRVGELFAVGEVTVLLTARDERTHRDVLIKALRSDLLRPPPGLPDPAAALTAEVRRLRHGLQTE